MLKINFLRLPPLIMIVIASTFVMSLLFRFLSLGIEGNSSVSIGLILAGIYGLYLVHRHHDPYSPFQDPTHSLGWSHHLFVFQGGLEKLHWFGQTIFSVLNSALNRPFGCGVKYFDIGSLPHIFSHPRVCSESQSWTKWIAFCGGGTQISTVPFIFGS